MHFKKRTVQFFFYYMFLQMCRTGKTERLLHHVSTSVSRVWLVPSYAVMSRDRGENRHHVTLRSRRLSTSYTKI